MSETGDFDVCGTPRPCLRLGEKGRNADIAFRQQMTHNVPRDGGQFALHKRMYAYSTTSSAAASSVCDIVRPSASRFVTTSNLVGCSIEVLRGALP
jgi:hypothetical protein